jgi:ribonuclease VapC
MFLDASVILAVALAEPEADDVNTRLKTSQALYTGPIAVFEASSRLSKVRYGNFEAALADVEEWLGSFSVQLIVIDATVMRAAHACAARYHHLTGHPARLNMGDCFAYASARTRALKLAYKGNDFSQTDVDGIRFGG